MSDGPVVAEEDIENPIEISCPECGTTGKVPGWWDGKRTECKGCGQRFTPEADA